jgi:hypothetical protein
MGVRVVIFIYFDELQFGARASVTEADRREGDGAWRNPLTNKSESWFL